jgi:hypothetical protein
VGPKHPLGGVTLVEKFISVGVVTLVEKFISVDNEAKAGHERLSFILQLSEYILGFNLFITLKTV